MKWSSGELFRERTIYRGRTKKMRATEYLGEEMLLWINLLLWNNSGDELILRNSNRNGVPFGVE